MARKLIFTEEQIEEIQKLVDEKSETKEEYIKKFDKYNKIVDKTLKNDKKHKNNE